MLRRTSSTAQPYPSLSQFNPLNQLPRFALLCGLDVPTLAPQVDGVIPALGEPILPLPVMRDHGTVHGTPVILGNGSNHQPVGAGRGPVVGPAGEDGEFEVGLHGVWEGEVLVVVVGVRVFVAACWSVRLVATGMVWIFEQE